jgi:nitrogen fixation/metabolism regulation signal transduction histidine kinase
MLYIVVWRNIKLAMKIKYRYIIYIVFLHLLIIFFAFDYFSEQRLWFLLVEGFLIASIFFGIHLYKLFVKPVDFISTGIKSIKDRDFSIKYIASKNTEINSLISVFNGMMDELREERRIMEEQNFFLDKLIFTLPIGIIIYDLNYLIRNINPLAEQIFNISEKDFIGKSIKNLNEKFATVIEDLAEGESETISIKGYLKYKISRAFFLHRGYHNQFVIIEEITNELIKTEKSAYGKVIRMMSHEVNNSVGAINSLIDSVNNFDFNGRVENLEDLNHALSIIKNRNESMNVFMRSFADVVRLPDPIKEKHDLVKLLKYVVEFYDALCKEKNIILNLSTDTEEFLINIDSEQIEQVIINAIKNAIDSIKENGIIKLKLESKNRILFIIDNGEGINKSDEEKIFTPFFSTKKGGQGIGLTLSKEIIHNHGFVIGLKNNHERGAIFYINFSN